MYAYLLRCANRRTHQCWPSYKTIGAATQMSVNTVRKHVCSLADKGLISTEDTTVFTKTGLKHNGSLLYTIRPIQLALNQFYEQQLAQMDAMAERQRVAKHSHSTAIARTQRDGLCAAVRPRCYPEGNKPPLPADAAVSKACARCAPSGEFSTTESGR